MTNATKAAVIAVLNTALGLAVAFGLNLTDEQLGTILALANALAALFIAVTYKNSSKRIPDAE